MQSSQIIISEALKTPLHILYIYAAALTLFASCGLSGSSFRIKGRFRDMQTGELYIYNLSAPHAKVDTLTIQDGKFLYRGEAEEETPYILVFPNGMEQVIFVGPAVDLEYEATANDLKNYVVNGSDENKLMNKFRQDTYTQNPSETKVTARRYIKDNPASVVAIYLLDRYFVQDEEVSQAELVQLLKELKAKHPHNHYLLDLSSKLANAEKTGLGKKLPNITLTKKDRATTKLWAKEKEYTLLLFWSTWMTSSNDLLWKLRSLANKYGEEGKLRLVAVSLDIERYRWEEAIRQDSTSMIEHYCDGLSFESKSVKTLGAEALPSYILTDKSHQVLARGTDAKEMEEELQKHLQPSANKE